tara:strand:- start:842 stop:2182 length:1341 start_codon:yes stop_codon:yes gene_type:complete
MIPNLNKILKEWSYRVGVIKPRDKKHVYQLEKILTEEGWSYEVIHGLIKNLTSGKKILDEVKFLKNIVSKLKRVWTSLKGKIKSLFSKKLKNLGPGEETVIKIPGLKTENKIEYMNLKDLINEGALQAIKGNYNEALTCQYIYGKDGSKGVGISPKYKTYKSEVDNIVKKWDTDLKNAVTNYSSAKSIIERGSVDMARYLIGTVLNEDAIIIGVYLDNLAFQGGVEFKADIQVAVMKEGKERLDAYSLKLYSGKSVGLANTSPKRLAGHLAGASAEKAVENAIKNDSRLQKLIQTAKDVSKKRRQAKKDGDTKEYDRLFKTRQEARKPINPRLAEITYNVLKPYVKTPSFSENLLKLLGFGDKDTKMLMAVTTAKKSIIIDKHPDLDVSNIDLRLKGVQILVVGPTGKTIVNFGVKEGEKKALAGKVSFADVEPVDLANYPAFEEK